MKYVTLFIKMTNFNNIQTYYLQGLKEASTLAKFIDPVLCEAGLDTEDIESVQEEYEVRTESSAVEIDRCLKESGKPVIFLQAKPIGRRDLFKVDYDKTFRAALCADVSFCVFTDGISWEFYIIEQSTESKVPQLLEKVEILYDPLKRVEIVQIFKNLIKGGRHES